METLAALEKKIASLIDLVLQLRESNSKHVQQKVDLGKKLEAAEIAQRALEEKLHAVENSLDVNTQQINTEKEKTLSMVTTLIKDIDSLIGT